MMKRRGHYSGTEIDGKWWKRYRKDGMFARGSGEYWHDSASFYFRRYLTKVPIATRFSDVKEIKIGTWHAGQWAAGRPIIKIIWEKKGLLLSSGFVLSKSRTEAEEIRLELESLMEHEDRQ